MTHDRGAYGLRVEGFEDPNGLLHDLDSSHARIRLVRAAQRGAPQPPPGVKGAPTVAIDDDVTATFHRDSNEVIVSGRRAVDEDELVHPVLSIAGLIFGHWLGRQVFHAGAFLTGSGAWAVVGQSLAGKSTLLAGLAARGVPILADDTLVLDGRTVLSGPRAIDLRQSAADALGLVDRVTAVRRSTRLRMTGPPAPAATQLAGWVSLTWGEDTAVRPLKGGAGWEALAAARKWPGPEDPVPILRLSGVPVHELRRARAWGSAPEAVDRLLDLTA